MTERDKDIHRIQEIRQLLESRQRFFSGQANTDTYKQTREDPIRLATMQRNLIESPSEPSLGHSIEANFGNSSNSGSSNKHINYPLVKMDSDDETTDTDEENNNAVDCRSGRYSADHSHNDSSSVISSEDEGKEKVEKKKTVKLRRRRTKSGSILHKRADQHLPDSEKAYPLKRNEKRFKNSPTPPSGSVSRKKSVSFHTKAVDDKDAKKLRKKSEADPLALLKKQSYQLKMEAAKKLDDTAAMSTLVKLDRGKVLGVTNLSLATAREKLKNAEKSLRVTVKTTENVPAKRYDYSFNSRRHPPTRQIPQPVELAKKSDKWIALRQVEEAAKNDLNLREAFAMIKIDPEPLLDLVHFDKQSKHRGSSAFIPDVKVENIHRSTSAAGTNIAFEDAETTKSLKRLTKLSVQHQKKQKSLIPESVKSQVVMQSMKGQPISIKQPIKLKTSEGKRGSVASTSSLRRKNSTTTTAGSRNQPLYKRRSKDFSGSGGPMLAFSSLEAALRAERKGLAGSEGSSHYGYYSVEKLSGTIL